jgi:TPR repeat protein
MDPNVELAAQAGDAAAMRILGEHYDYYKGSWEVAGKWLLAAAEAGDPQAMYELAVHDRRMGTSAHDQDGVLVGIDWRRRAAEAGHVQAMTDMIVDSESPGEKEFWQRRAAEGGDPSSMLWLGRWLEEEGQTAEAEQWYRAAIDSDYPVAGRFLADLLIRQGRLVEAERYARLADRHAPGLPDLWDGELTLLTAVVTTAVVPFVQTLASKASEDAYGQARQLIRRLLRKNGVSDNSSEEAPSSAPAAGDTEPGLAVVQDPDSEITLFLWSNASDEALRALSALDLTELRLRKPDQGRVHLVWHPASGSWHIRGQATAD